MSKFIGFVTCESHIHYGMIFIKKRTFHVMAELNKFLRSSQNLEYL